MYCIVGVVTLCLWALFIVWPARANVRVALFFCEERDSFPLARSLAKRTKKRERNTRAAYEPQHFLIADISVVCTGTPKN